MVFEELKDYISLLGKSFVLTQETMMPPPQLLSDDAKFLRKRWEKEFDELKEELDEKLQRYGKLPLGKSYKKINNVLDRYDKKIKRLNKRYIDLYREKQNRAKIKLNDTV